MKKLAQSIDATLAEDKTPKTESWIAQYKFMQSWNEHDVSEACIEKITEDLLIWTRDENNLLLEEFLDSKGIRWEQINAWCKKFPMLNNAYKSAKIALAKRRERGLIEFKYSAAGIVPTMTHYSPIWREERIFLEGLRKQNPEEGGTVIVETKAEEQTPQVTEAKQKRSIAKGEKVAIANGKKNKARSVQAKRVSKTSP